MTHTLYLRLAALDADAAVEGLVVAADGSVIAEALSGTLAEFATRHPGAAVVALIPGAEALSTTAHLPKMAAAKVRASLPYALEELLAGDLEAQHFAMGRGSARDAASGREGASAGGASGAPLAEPGLDVPVIVMLRARLAAWLELLRGQGLGPAAMYLEDSCVAAKPGDVIGWMRAGELLLRTPSGEALVTRIDDLAAALQLLPTDPPAATLGLQIHASPADRAAFGALVEGVAAGFSRVNWLATAISPLPWLVSQLAIAKPIDLLQGEFTPRKPKSVGIARWRLVAALLATMLLLYLGERIFVWQRDATEAAVLERALFDAVQSARPDVQSMTDANALLQTRGGAGRVMTTALADLAAAGVATDSIGLIAVEAGNVRIEFRSALATDGIEKSLTAANWQVRKDATTDGRAALTLNRRGRGSTP